MKEKNENQFKLTDFDYLTADPKLQMLKAAIPYLPVSQQRAVSLLVKIQELQRAQSLFDGEEISAMGLSPVSYTHLDVYKRQVQKSSRTCFRRPGAFFRYSTSHSIRN